MTLARGPPERTSYPTALRGPSCRDALPTTVEELQLRLEAAGGALMGLQVRGLRPDAIRSAMPAPLHTEEEAYGWLPLIEDDMPLPVPCARGISAMDGALAWVSLIPLQRARPGSGMLHSQHGGAVLRRIVLARSAVNPRTGRATFSWRRLGHVLRCSPESARTWHAAGLSLILAALHRSA